MPIPFKDLIVLIKDSAAGLREVLLVALLLVLLFNPPIITGWLASSGLDKFSAFGFSVETRKAAEASRNQNLAVANNLQAVELRARLAEQKLEQMKVALAGALATSQNQLPQLPPERGRDSADAQPPTPTSVPPQPPVLSQQLRQLSAQVDALAGDLGRTRMAAQRAQVQTRAAVVKQAAIIEKAGGAVRLEGWVWVGQIAAGGEQLRDVGVPETVVAPATLVPDRLVGTQLRFSATTDIYRAPFDGASQRSAIVGVASPKDVVRVREARLIRFARQGSANRNPDDQILWARIAPD